MRRTLMLLALLAAGIFLRLVFVVHQPFTNDEGSYLYDVKTFLDGRLPAGDVLTKSPVTLGFFMVGVWLTDGSLYAARVVSVLINVLTAFPLAALAARLFGRSSGRFAGLLWLFGSGPILFLGLGQTETVAIFLAVTSLALWARALESHSSRDRRAQLALLAGLALAAAFASRKTSLTLGVPGLLLTFWAPLARTEKWRAVLWALTGCLFVLAPWLVLVYRQYGSVGVSEALGLGYGDVIFRHALDPTMVPSWASGGVTHTLRVVMRTAWPLWALAVFGLSVPLWAKSRERTRILQSVAIPASWVAALGVLYTLWPTILPEYFAEFFAPATLLAVAGISWATARTSRPRQWGGAVLLTASTLWCLQGGYRTPWTGMFTATAVRQAAREVQARVPPNEPIFTAALLVPYLSGHRVPFDIAHPLWYRMAFIPPERKDVFLPPLRVVEDEVRTRVRWVLVEHLTDYAYLRHPSDLLGYIWKNFQFVATIPNETGYRSNPILLWQR